MDILKKVLSFAVAGAITVSSCLPAFAADNIPADISSKAVGKYQNGTHEFIKISHPDKPANTRKADVKYSDGIVDYIGNGKLAVEGTVEGANGQGSRGQTYCWGSVAYGDWMYVNTLYNAAGNTANLFPTAGDDSISPDLINKISNILYSGDIFLAEEDGGTPGCVLVKINVKTGETKIIMSTEMTEDSYGNDYNGFYSKRGIEPQFRNALEFNGKLYFCGAISGIPSIWEVDPENNDAFRRVYADPVLVKNPGLIVQAIQKDKLCSSIRGMTVFDNRLVISCVGPDANPYIAVSNTSDPIDGFTKIATTWVEGTDNTVPGQLLGYPACRLTDSIYGGSIWEMIEFDGKLYVALCTGTPANKPGKYEMQSFAIMCGEYNGEITDPDAWSWHVVVGDEKDGAPYTYGIDPERTRSGACCMMVFKDHLYVGEYNDTEIAMLDMIQGFDTGFMAENFEQSVNLYRMDKNEKFELVAGDPTEMFPESLSGLRSGFGENEVDHGNQYIWQMKVFQDKLYIGTFDESVVLYPLAQISNGDLLEWTREDWAKQIELIKDLIQDLIKDSSKPKNFWKMRRQRINMNKLLHAQNEMETFMNDTSVNALSLPTVMSEGNSINSLAELHQSMVLMTNLLEQSDSWSIEQKIASKEMFAELYTNMYDCYNNNPDLFKGLPNVLQKALKALYEKILNNEKLAVIVNMGRCLYYLKDCTDGFDFFVTSDGEHLDCITRNGLGDPYNQGIRTFAASRDPENPWLCLGTANLFYGTQVWRMEGEGLNLAPVIPEPEKPEEPEFVEPDYFNIKFINENGEVVLEQKLEGLEGIFAPVLPENYVWKAEAATGDGADVIIKSEDYVSSQTLDLDYLWTEKSPDLVLKAFCTVEMPEKIEDTFTVKFVNEDGTIALEKLLVENEDVIVPDLAENYVWKASDINGVEIVAVPGEIINLDALHNNLTWNEGENIIEFVPFTDVVPEPEMPEEPEDVLFVQPEAFNVKFIDSDGNVVLETKLENYTGIFAPTLETEGVWVSVDQNNSEIILHYNDYVSADSLDLDYLWTETVPSLVFNFRNN